jgi:GTP-binding protein EngB required for normal cell division
MHEINERNKYIYENPRYYRRLFNSACEKIEINYTPQQYQVINSIDVRISLCISKCDKIDEINDLARIEKLNVYLKLLKKLSFQTKNSRINPKHFDIFIQ